MNTCRAWAEGGPILEAYHDHEWCKVKHDDDFAFMMLCLEGASVGLSWQSIMHKKAAYRAAFHDFKMGSCALMADEELEAQRSNPGIIREQEEDLQRAEERTGGLADPGGIRLL